MLATVSSNARIDLEPQEYPALHWADEGIILDSKPLGERDNIIHVITPHHGRYAGLVKFGQSKKYHPILQPANILSLHWQARLSEQLGTMQVELIRSPTPLFFHDSLRMLALQSMLQMMLIALPEREPHFDLFQATESALRQFMIDEKNWVSAYIRWEFIFLQSMGFGLQLDQCVVSGSTDSLSYVSPKTGCAVTEQIGLPYHDKLLAYPQTWNEPQLDHTDYLKALTLTGHFIRNVIFSSIHRPLPASRISFMDGLQQQLLLGFFE